ncbi:diguanylate cyclase domain-containing protein [Tautonia marina]|uniref:diguanylate cyclase domain-containing protein n=1 Tax=Tautonia marina TaxID=2653855 RepID=UPI0012612629|nr:diguanylate cyclase [Tautonia marina]
MVVQESKGLSERGRQRSVVSNFFQRTLDSLLSHVAILRPDGTIVAVNAAWNAYATRNGLVESLCGPGVNYLEVCEAASGSCTEQARLIARGIRDVGEGLIPDFQLEYPCHSPTAHQWFTIRVTRFTVGKQTRIVVTHDDITRLKRVELELQEANRLLAAQATTDGLTGLANRRHFDEVLAREWKRHARSATPLSLLLLDLDHFKLYNDFRGHLAGDDCLRAAAELIQASVCRPGDLVARYGGEEFAAVLPETDRDGALAMAKRVSDQLRLKALPHQAPGAGPFVTLSIGSASVVPSANVPPESLIEQADHALYAAKAAGRDQMKHADSSGASMPAPHAESLESP